MPSNNLVYLHTLPALLTKGNLVMQTHLKGTAFPGNGTTSLHRAVQCDICRTCYEKIGLLDEKNVSVACVLYSLHVCETESRVCVK